MRISFVIGAEFRDTQGKGASRRLRVTGKVPAILYGGGQNPRALVLDQQKLLTMIDNEKFYSSIVQLKVANETQEAIVKDVQMHPAKNVVVHLDLQRVLENEKLRIRQLSVAALLAETIRRIRAEESVSSLYVD